MFKDEFCTPEGSPGVILRGDAAWHFLGMTFGLQIMAYSIGRCYKAGSIMMPICLSHHIFLFQSFSRKARYAPSWANQRHDSRESIAS